MNKSLQKVLLVGSSFSAAPIFFCLKRRGLKVAVCGNHEHDPCHQYADESFFLDYSRQEELLKLVERERFDYIVPTCNDYSYMSCAFVAQKLGLPGFDRFDTAEILHTKKKFRQVTEQHELAAPKSYLTKNAEAHATDDFRYPLLIKPIDSFSGRGVTKISAESELSEALRVAQNASRSGEAIIEEFVIGNLYSHSAFISNKEIVLDFFVDEYCTVYPYQVNCSNHPSKLPEAARTLVRESISKLIKILDLTDGLLHTQFISHQEEVWIIECMRRCPGDLYGNLIERSTGVKYIDLFTRSFIGESLTTQAPTIGPIPFGRHTISTKQALVNYTFTHNIPAIQTHYVPLKNSGERLGIAPFDKLGILFAEFADNEALWETAPRLADFISIEALESLYCEPKAKH